MFVKSLGVWSSWKKAENSSKVCKNTGKTLLKKSSTLYIRTEAIFAIKNSFDARIGNKTNVFNMLLLVDCHATQDSYIYTATYIL